jgi:hypothetical protein
LLSVTDPQGRFVRLTQETWDCHIVSRHPDIVPDWIQEVLEDPDLIALDTSVRRPLVTELCYYRRGLLPTVYGNRYLKVITRQRALHKTCYMISAYPADHLKPEERTIWNRPKS